MAKNPKPAPSPADPNAPQDWVPPKSDQEFVFESVDAAPAWIDKGWASFSQGPALAVPQGHLDGTGPYHTAMARVGDTVKFVAAKGAKEAHIVVIQGEPDPTKEGQVTKKPPQVTNASLEDLLRTGLLAVGDLGEDARAQVAVRSPGLKNMIENEEEIADAQKVSDIVKVD
jgi:hypothetical protein